MKISTTDNIIFSGLGHYLPRREVSNEELMSLFRKDGSSVDDAVIGDISVTTRRWSDEEETVQFMARHAIGMALEHAGVLPDSVDLLLLSNWTERRYVPDLAPRVAHESGLRNALAFDICGACTGFILGVHTAVAYLRAGLCKRVVVVGSDQFSKGVRPESKGLLIVGDAAGAAVLERSDQTLSGIIDLCLNSEGEYWDIVGSKLPEPWIRSKKELPEHAADRAAKASLELLTRNRMDIGDVDWVVPHPGTDRVQESFRKHLCMENERKIAENFTECGNTSSASIPIVLSEFCHQGKIRRNHLVLTPAIGAGFYHGALLFRL